MSTNKTPSRGCHTSNNLRRILIVWQDCQNGDTRLAAFIRREVETGRSKLGWEQLKCFGITAEAVAGIEHLNLVQVAQRLSQSWKLRPDPETAEKLAHYLDHNGIEPCETQLEVHDLKNLELTIQRPLRVRGRNYLLLENEEALPA